MMRSAMSIQESPAATDERAGFAARKGIECRLDLVFAARLQDQ